ncbi:hypothetical protein C1H46_013610 [Malus baccata]|uniref:Uncharacterized protein n=1 Tax=Malus baccata TaxID=106549 RepID=A0A540MPX0_MALBA|nr:hypothetical protein C1H46_013610 [Malus baccata]
MIADSIAGMVEHMAMFTVDTVKTHMQALGSCPIKTVGLRQAIQSILKSEGPAGLYREIGAMGLDAGPAHAIYFSVYEMSKKFFSGGNLNKPAAHTIFNVFTTVVSDAIFSPIDMVKQRLYLGTNLHSPYKETTMLMNALDMAVHFTMCEAAKRALNEISPEHADDERLIVHTTVGAAAGGLVAVVTTPLDVVKTQL